MDKWFPDRKVWAGVLGAALFAVVMWVCESLGVAVPESLRENLGYLMFAVGYGVSYWVPKPGDAWFPSMKSGGAPSDSAPG